VNTTATSSSVGSMTTTTSVSAQFRSQLEVLINTLRSTDPHYIKCIKPNAMQVPLVFNASLVMEQLRYSGVLEVVRIRREGYPVREKFLDFYRNYEVLLLMNANKPIHPINVDGSVGSDSVGGGSGGTIGGDGEDELPPMVLRRGTANKLTASEEDIQIARQCCSFIAKHSLIRSEYQIGRTAVFMKDGCFDVLQAQLRMIYNRSATTLQSLTRCTFLWRKFRHLRLCTIRLQSMTRRFVAMSKYHRVCKATKLIQYYQRTCILRKQFLVIYRQIIFQRRTNAATRIQSFYRRLVAIAIVKYRLQCWHVIKRTVNSYLVRNRFLLIRKSIITIQKYARGKLARTVRKHLYSRFRKAVIIQSWYRRSIQLRLYKCIRYACIKIQAILRRYGRYRHYKRMIQSIIIIQKNARSFKIRCHYLHTLQWIMDLQRVIRGYLARCSSRHLIRFRRVVKVQSWIRSVFVRYRFHRILKCCILIQAVSRQHIARRRYCCCIEAIIIIQSTWRMHCQLNKYQSTRRSIACCQNFIRLYLVRIHYKAWRHRAVYAIIQIQTFIRGVRVKRLFKIKLQAVKTMQQFIRVSISRNRITRRIKDMIRHKARLCKCIYSYHRRLVSHTIIQSYNDTIMH